VGRVNVNRGIYVSNRDRGYLGRRNKGGIEMKMGDVMVDTSDARINIKIRMSLWQAIKIRISGIFKNAKNFRQAGDYIIIDYKE